MPYTRIGDFPTDPTGTKPVCPDCASALTIGGALSKNGGVGYAECEQCRKRYWLTG
jgi:hypothetical protein